MRNIGFTVDSPLLVAREHNTFNDVFEYADFLIRAVKAVLPAGAIKPGLEYHPSLIEMEESPERFATADALGAFARAATERTKEELEAESHVVMKLARLIAQNIPADMLRSRCLDISWVLTGMLEQLGIWAVTYRGTLLYIGHTGKMIGKLYYVNDVLAPPGGDNVARGHSWVWTPSVAVIDLTVKYQPLPAPVVRHLSGLILEIGESMPCDLGGLYFDQTGPKGYQNAARNFFGSRKVWPEWNRLHTPLEVSGRITLRYVPMDIGFPDAPLAENPGYARGIMIGGLTPLEFLDHYRPELHK